MTTPSYLVAADSHSTLNNPTDEGFIESVGSAISGAAKFAGLAVGAGAVEAWNTIPTIGNWLGGDFERVDYKAAVADLDDDLAKYYTEHQLGIDTVGFIAGSLVPGMAGVKMLKAGQTVLRGAITEGTIGGNTGTALGLLAPKHEQHLAAAVKQIRESGNPFSMIEANTLRAIGAGFGQNALEAAAFETMVASTMYQSPILNEMDASDMLWNGLIGVGLGGAIGGSISGLFTSGAIKRGASAAERELLPWTIRDAGYAGSSTSDKILNYTNQLRTMPEVPTTGDLVARAGRTAEQTRNTLHLKIREEFGNLANDDQAVAQTVFDSWKIIEQGNPNQNIANLMDSTAIGRASAITGVEKELRVLDAKIKKVGIDALTDEERATWRDTHVTWVKVRGTDAGTTTTSTPEILSLTDRMRADGIISLTKDGRGIQVGKRIFEHENNPNRAYNILGLDHYTTESRFLWAEHSPRWATDADNIILHETDIPLLEKALRDGVEKIKVIPEGSPVDQAYTLSSKDEITKLLKDKKIDIADRLAKGKPELASIDTVVDKLRYELGINFNIVDDPTGGYNGFFTRIQKKIGLGAGKSTELEGHAIGMERAATLARSMSEIVRTLKHEEGHSIFQVILDARGVSRQNLEVALPGLVPEMIAISKKVRPSLWKANDQKMQDYLRSHHELFADSFSWLSRNVEQLKKFPAFEEFAGHLVRPVPQEVLDGIVRRVFKPTPAEIAKIVNVDEGILRGEITEAGWMARTKERDIYKKQMEATGTRPNEQVADPLHLPSWIKVISKEQRTKGLDGNELTGLAAVSQRARLYEESATRASMAVTTEKLPDISLQDLIKNLNGGPGFVSFENSAYGTAGSLFAYVGQRTHNIIKNVRQATSDLFTPTLSKLANDTDAAIEWSVLNEKMRSLPQAYRLSEEGTSLVLRGNDEQVARMVSEGVPAEIKMQSPLVQQLVADHIGANGGRISKLKPIRSNEGFMDKRDPDLFYPIPRNSKDTPFFAFVIDDTVTGTGHGSMIYAASEKDLVAMKNEILQKTPHLKVLTKADSEQYFKSHGQFSFERTLSERNINWEMKRNGVSASYLPVTDPAKIVQDFLEWHLQRDSSLVREAVSHRYSRQFETLRSTAKESMQAATSKFGYTSTLAHLETGVNDPAMNLIKMALDVQKTSEFPFWNSFGKMLDEKVSSVWSNIERGWQNATSPEHLTAINSSLKAAGYGGPVVDEALYRVMNAAIPRGTLTAAVNKMNGLLATFALRLDPLNALNNVVGSSVLLGTELKAVTEAIKRGNPEAVGELAALMKLAVPGAGGEAVTSPTKLIANSITRYHDKTAREFYKQHGFISSITDQYDQTLDALAISAVDTLDTLNSKIANGMKTAKKFGDKGEMLTGNKFAEEFNRFVAADVMKQITDVAVKHGVLDERSALSYINTFVNRTQGNYIASQRPMMFQGPVGQAIGLFQTYQFNLIQQLLRHVQDGELKTVATMMGLQGSVYGMNGLPAFNAINTHIIGNASGNKNHTDLYQAAYSAGGKEAGDWLVYGGLSNALSIFHPDLKMNMYTRGDINPRSITLVPTDPSKVPIVQAFTKMTTNMYEMGSQVLSGGDVFGAFMRSLEHNGVSRPLAGLAQVLEGSIRPDNKVISTSNKDNILMAHDLLNLASLTRLAGGKPLDEAIVNDTMFRINAYKARDASRLETLGSAIKISTLSGNAPDQEQIDGFAATYAEAGGKQANFVKFMARQYKNVNSSQANQFRDKLSSPYALNLQRVMGGYEVQDLQNDGE